MGPCLETRTCSFLSTSLALAPAGMGRGAAAAAGVPAVAAERLRGTELHMEAQVGCC